MRASRRACTSSRQYAFFRPATSCTLPFCLFISDSSAPLKSFLPAQTVGHDEDDVLRFVIARRPARATGEREKQARSRTGMRRRRNVTDASLNGELAALTASPAGGTLSESARIGFDNLHQKRCSTDDLPRIVAANHCGKIAGMLQNGEAKTRGAPSDGLVGPGEIDGMRRRDAFAFGDGDELIRMNAGNGFLAAAGPHDFQRCRSVRIRLAETKRQRQLALRQIARSGLHHRESMRRPCWFSASPSRRSHRDSTSCPRL